MTKTGYARIPTGEEPVAVAIMDDVTPSAWSAPTMSSSPTAPSAPSAPSASAGPVIAETTVIPSTTTTTPIPTITISRWGRTPTHMDICPHCRSQHVHTETRSYPSFLTWVLTGIMFVLLWLVLLWPFFWIPLCVDCCKQTDHFCPHCHGKVGTTKPLEDWRVAETY